MLCRKYNFIVKNKTRSTRITILSFKLKFSLKRWKWMSCFDLHTSAFTVEWLFFFSLIFLFIKNKFSKHLHLNHTQIAYLRKNWSDSKTYVLFRKKQQKQQYCPTSLLPQCYMFIELLKFVRFIAEINWPQRSNFYTQSFISLFALSTTLSGNYDDLNYFCPHAI